MTIFVYFIIRLSFFLFLFEQSLHFSFSRTCLFHLIEILHFGPIVFRFLLNLFFLDKPTRINVIIEDFSLEK